MFRLNSLRWAALPLGLFVTLAITQCVDSLSDDCTKTLTCGSEAQVTLDSRCQWRYPDGGIWTEGPTQDPITARWKWPDGTETATQDFRCDPNGAGGADAGVSEPDCKVFGCDSPRQCDEPSRRCVECLDDTACALNLPMGDAGAAGVCDTRRKECVRCLKDEHCADPTPICRALGGNTDLNECVECTIDEQCGASEPVCDTSSYECTLRCTGTEPGECSGSPDKSVCNGTRGLCVECDEGSNTCSGETSQCNITSNECVECVNDAPCMPLGQVCDEASNRCVQCETNTECEGVEGKPVCDAETNLCVQCLNHTECTAPGASRCNAASNECAPCTATAQCEGGAVCNADTGVCVQCTSNDQCTMMGANAQCELTSGTCVQCTDNAHCLATDAARCETAPGAANRFTCQPCTGNAECGDALCSPNGVCVECLELAGCSDRPNASFCSSGGACVPCAIDAHCAAVTDLNACLVAGGDARCVECVDDVHCTSGEVCKKSNAGPAAGPPGVNTCVECVNDTNCTDPTASRCVQNQCVACQANAHCAGIDSTPGAPGGTPLNVCEAGVCVECTAQFPQACGDNVCNGQTRICSEFPIGLTGTCGECVSDAQCVTGQLCTRQLFLGQPVGNRSFCFSAPGGAAPSCAAFGQFRALRQVTSIDGEPAGVCQLSSSTCAALADRLEPQACDEDTDCGEPNQADGACVIPSGGDSGLCSTVCTNGLDCSPPSLCEALGSGVQACSQ